MKFRSDIEGLRAVAVAAIVLFHINPKIFPGGFIGVDVFFVISGYLITDSIRLQMEAHNFKLTDFYARRIRRLFPALFVSLIGTSVLAYIVLLPAELIDFSKSALATVTYVSNLYFYATTGYFARDANSVALLHTWSLAVEEQFYLIFPLFIILIRKLSRSGFLIALLIAAALSLALSEFLVQIDTPAAFFMAPSRFWQFLLGGATALYAAERIKHKFNGPTLAVVGLIVLAVCLAAYRSRFPFPGIAAVPPTLATCLILYGGSAGTSWAFSALSARPLRLVGRWSYSIYLWHWPLIVFFRLAIDGKPTPLEQVILVVGSVALGAVSYYLVERPAQKLTISRPKAVIARAVAATACLSGVMAVPIVNDGLPSRVSPEVARLAAYLDYDKSGYRHGTCFLGGGGSELFDEDACMEADSRQMNLLLVGDSHAAHFRAQMSALFPSYSVSQVSASGCKPTSPTSGLERCTTLMDRVRTKYAKERKFDAIVISAQWNTQDASGLAKFISEVEQYSRVIVIGPNVEYDLALPRLLILAKSSPLNGVIERTSSYARTVRIDDEIRRAVAGTTATYLSAVEAQCPGGKCIVQTSDGAPLLFDGNHFTEEGSALMLAALQKSMVSSEPTKRTPTSPSPPGS